MIKVCVSKIELAKYKVNSETVHEFSILIASGYIGFDSEFWAQIFMQDLEKMGVFYTVRRKRGEK